MRQTTKLSTIHRIGKKYFPALYQRNFRLFWLGQWVSVIGTWMQNVGQDWLVLELTGSPSKLSIVAALQFLPMMVLTLFAGPFIDRLPKRKVLIATQTSLAVLALALALITWTHVVQYWMILILAFLLGMVQLVDNPTRQSYVIEMAGRDALMNAVSLNSVVFNLARIMGPAIAGLMIEAIGIAPCFFINALSFVAVIGALLLIKTAPVVSNKPIQTVRDVLASSKEGLAYIKARPKIALPLILMAVVSTFVINYTIFVPTFTKINLGMGASAYGFLMTAMGAGSLLAALALAVRSGQGPGRLRLFGGAAGACAGILLCGLQRNFMISCALLAFVGFCSVSFTASTNVTIQLESENEYRGRVMSIYALVFGGVTPIGSLWTGIVSDATSPATCMTISGCIGLASCAFIIAFILRHSKRRVD
jgi:MFS family permease